jgi:DNA-directed RNA polymerase specialized sigma subunit
MEAVAQHSDELPHREQQILILCFYGNHTQKEVAARLGCPRCTCPACRHGAMARLRDRIFGLAGSRPQPGGTT